MKNLIICSSQPIMIAGFQTIIRTAEEFAVSVCSSATDLRERVLAGDAHIVLADAACGITLNMLTDLHTSAPATGLILWVDSVPSEFISQAISLGVLGILRKNAGVEACLQCLRQVSVGELWVENETSKKLMRTRTIPLSPRQRQLAGMLAQGLKNKEIAYKMGITEGTVKVYLSHLYEKVGANDRFELALFVLKNLATDQSSASDNLASDSLSTAAPYFMPAFLSFERRPECVQ